MQFDLSADDSIDATEPVAPGTSCTTECYWTGTTWICYEEP